MVTVEECQAKAAEKRELAVSDPDHRLKHRNAADSWLILAIKLESIHLNYPSVVPLPPDRKINDRTDSPAGGRTRDARC